MKKSIPDYKQGLSKKEVEDRINKGLVNYDTTIKTKSNFVIILSHVFTLFNILNFCLVLIVLFLNSYKNGLFFIVVIFNTLIGIITEIKAKKVVDELSIFKNDKVCVVRDGIENKIDIFDIVLDDVIKLSIGDQIMTDSVILDGNILVNESFITGEADIIPKGAGDKLLSGSFVVGGKCFSKVEHIGDDNYASVISKEAKYIKKISSEIMNSLNKIIKFVSIIIVPLGIIFLIKELSINDLNTSLLNMVAAVIGMIPDGLVLLTSTVLTLSMIRLSKKGVLVQNLYAIETLARVDTICLDKTGTLTTGNINLDKVIELKDINIDEILSHFTNNFSHENKIIEVLSKKYNKKLNVKIDKKEEFSSEVKYSMLSIDKKIYKLGAVEYISSTYDKEEYLNYCKSYRVVGLSMDDELIAYILFSDEIRAGIKSVIDMFNENKVDIKIISGDNPLTVSTVANTCNIMNYEKFVDLSDIPNNKIDSVINNTVFGRVKPKQKKLIIESLKRNGHTVAMVGDGVNDVLALKEADSSIAVKEAMPAARNVSEIILLDSNIGMVCGALKEGRRVINNMERSSILFLTKTMYNTLFLLFYLFVNFKYPFNPIHLTLISVVTIGIPGFILSLEPNTNVVKKDFLKNILKYSLPVSINIFINIIIVNIVSYIFKIDVVTTRSIAVLLITFISFTSLYRICKPFNKLRISLFSFLIIIFLIAFIFFRDFFGLSLLGINHILLVILLSILSVLLFKILNLIIKKIIDKRK